MKTWVDPNWSKLGDENTMTCVAATHLGLRLHGFIAAGEACHRNDAWAGPRLVDI